MGRNAWLQGWLLEVIAANPGLGSGALCKRIGGRRGIVQTALSQMKKRGLIVGRPDPGQPSYKFLFYPKESTQ